jgi:signal transduction histidine kinase
MHDLVAHSVSNMVVQAGAARTVLKSDPGKARKAVAIVQEVGRTAITELDQLLALLRRGTSGATLGGPQHDVQELISQARQSGLEVELQRSGSHPPEAGGSLEVFEYRIVQEALTNVRKHARDARVVVHLQHDLDAVVVRIQDDGATGPRSEVAGLGAGQGLVGMRERVALVGGSFEAGPRANGGFSIEAVMPRERVLT